MAPSGAPTGFWDVDYSGTTRIFGLDAEVSATLTPESYALVSLAWRNTENSFTGQPLPYAPGFQAGATYRHTFPLGVTLQTDLNIYGSQFADLAASQRITGYTIWDIRAEYEIIPLFAVGAGFQNILDQSFERWRGYAGVPRTAILFGRYSW
jgi:outer membrane cobalamin receptor